MSTESGLPDFRSPGSAAACAEQYGYPPETILSAGFLRERPALFSSYCRECLAAPAEPNAGHLALARLEKSGRLLGILTQNVDGLHQKAGNRKVLELHGNISEYRCADCGRYLAARPESTDGIPRCPDCGGIARPDIVLYDEALNEYVLRAARARMTAADLLLIIGTSLSVFPAAGLPELYGGKEIVIINREKTPLDDRAALRFTENCGQVLDASIPRQ